MRKIKDEVHYFARIPFNSEGEKDDIMCMIEASGIPVGRYIARILRESYAVWKAETAKKKMRKREKKETLNGQNT